MVLKNDLLCIDSAVWASFVVACGSFGESSCDVLASFMKDYLEKRRVP